MTVTVYFLSDRPTCLIPKQRKLSILRAELYAISLALMTVTITDAIYSLTYLLTCLLTEHYLSLKDIKYFIIL